MGTHCSAGNSLILAGVFTIFIPALAYSQSSAPEVSPTVVLPPAQARLLNDWKSMPRYTCMQKITRRLYRMEGKTPQSCSAILAHRGLRQHEPPVLSWDHLELEVAVAERREVHSWPGASSFADEDDIRKILGNGPFATGDFAAFIGGIFGGSAAIQFTRQMAVNGRNLFEYSFQVKKGASRYEVDSAAGPVITGYEGSFLLDPQLEDLVHLTVRTEELPAKTAMCQAISDIEYGRTTIHDTNVLIPRETNLRLVLADGEEAATITSYSACRKFASKSVLLFEGITQDRAEAKWRSESEAQQTPQNPFPEGSRLSVESIRRLIPIHPQARPSKAPYALRFEIRTT
jgi:hypothetical protein